MIVRDAEGICGSVLKKAFLVSKLRDLCAINDILVLDISYPLRPQCTANVSVVISTAFICVLSISCTPVVILTSNVCYYK